MTSLLLAALAATPALQLRSRVDGGEPVSGWVYARAGQAVVLEAAVAAEVKDAHWFKVEPAVGAVDNTWPKFHFAPVTYQETELAGCAGKLRCPASLEATALPAVPALPGAGTMAFKVRVTLKDGRVLETPGKEAVKYGGLTKAVHRVTLRRDDSLIGYASELINTPYIFGSAGPDGRNQSDLLIGSDCADLIVYARRRMGKRAEYTSSYALDRQAPPLAPGVPAREGDVVHFPSSRHVAILFKDNPPKGVVDEGDLILHTCWAPPAVQRIGEVPQCASLPYRVLRFPDPPAAGPAARGARSP